MGAIEGAIRLDKARELVHWIGGVVPVGRMGLDRARED